MTIALTALPALSAILSAIVLSGLPKAFSKTLSTAPFRILANPRNALRTKPPPSFISFLIGSRDSRSGSIIFFSNHPPIPLAISLTRLKNGSNSLFLPKLKIVPNTPSLPGIHLPFSSFSPKKNFSIFGPANIPAKPPNAVTIGPPGIVRSEGSNPIPDMPPTIALIPSPPVMKPGRALAILRRVFFEIYPESSSSSLPKISSRSSLLALIMPPKDPIAVPATGPIPRGSRPKFPARAPMPAPAKAFGAYCFTASCTFFSMMPPLRPFDGSSGSIAGPKR